MLAMSQDVRLAVPRLLSHRAIPDDVVLAMGISLLLFTCPQLERLAKGWARLNIAVENAVVQRCTGVPAGLVGRVKQS